MVETPSPTSTIAVDENDEELRGEVDNGEYVVLQITVEGDQGPAEADHVLQSTGLPTSR